MRVKILLVSIIMTIGMATVSYCGYYGCKVKFYEKDLQEVGAYNMVLHRGFHYNWALNERRYGDGVAAYIIAIRPTDDPEIKEVTFAFEEDFCVPYESLYFWAELMKTSRNPKVIYGIGNDNPIFEINQQAWDYLQQYTINEER